MLETLRLVLRFVRSVLPADLAQLLFLLGVICLFIAPHVYWPPAQFQGQTVPASKVWLWCVLLAPYFIIFSGAAGYFICFWPGTRPIRRILFFIFLPAVLGFAELYGTIRYVASEAAGGDSHISTSIWKLGVGADLALLGLILVASFVVRLTLGISSLPLALPKPSLAPVEDGGSWYRSKIILWIQLALVGPIDILAGLLLAGLLYLLILLRIRSAFLGSVLSWLGTALPTLPEVAAAAIVVLIAICVAGREGAQALRRSIRLPWPESFAIALALPIGIRFFIALAFYFVDRVHWAAHDFGRFGIQQGVTSFHLPGAGTFFLMFIPALSEEIIFRGMLQPRFLQRYGIFRGIVLVSTVWAAEHYFVDFDSHRSANAILFKLAFRLVDCLALGFVLSWLTIRFKSVLPAAVTHATENAFVLSSPGAGLATTFLWILAAYILFRCWPVETPAMGETVRRRRVEVATE